MSLHRAVSEVWDLPCISVLAPEYLCFIHLGNKQSGKDGETAVFWLAGVFSIKNLLIKTDPTIGWHTSFHKIQDGNFVFLNSSLTLTNPCKLTHDFPPKGGGGGGGSIWNFWGIHEGIYTQVFQSWFSTTSFLPWNWGPRNKFSPKCMSQ